MNMNIEFSKEAYLALPPEGKEAAKLLGLFKPEWLKSEAKTSKPKPKYRKLKQTFTGVLKSITTCRTCGNQQIEYFNMLEESGTLRTSRVAYRLEAPPKEDELIGVNKSYTKRCSKCVQRLNSLPKEKLINMLLGDSFAPEKHQELDLSKGRTLQYFNSLLEINRTTTTTTTTTTTETLVPYCLINLKELYLNGDISWEEFNSKRG